MAWVAGGELLFAIPLVLPSPVHPIPAACPVCSLEMQAQILLQVGELNYEASHGICCILHPGGFAGLDPLMGTGGRGQETCPQQTARPNTILGNFRWALSCLLFQILSHQGRSLMANPGASTAKSTPRIQPRLPTTAAFSWTIAKGSLAPQLPPLQLVSHAALVEVMKMETWPTAPSASTFLLVPLPPHSSHTKFLAFPQSTS